VRHGAPRYACDHECDSPREAMHYNLPDDPSVFLRSQFFHKAA
jgi:hypothetical protein